MVTSAALKLQHHFLNRKDSLKDLIKQEKTRFFPSFQKTIFAPLIVRYLIYLYFCIQFLFNFPGNVSVFIITTKPGEKINGKKNLALNEVCDKTSIDFNESRIWQKPYVFTH